MSESPNELGYYHEAARDVPMVEETDVLVCGAGPAGVAAAITAARAGARVRLIETHGCLGGVWTAGLLSWILDKDNKPGLMREILDRLDAMGALRDAGYDAEAMKLLLETLCMEAGVDVRLHTHVVAAARDAENRLAVVITESKSGREAWAARCFIDASGDGDLAAFAGCGFDLGRGESSQTQPMSLLGLITGMRFEELYAHRLIRGPDVDKREAKQNLLEIMQSLGLDPSYTRPTLYPVRDDLLGIMANHEYHASALNAQQLTDATLRARGEVNHLVDRLRSLGGIWQNMRLVATAEQIGVREARRIHGRYIVSEDDLRLGRQHDDAVCRVTFPIDVHSPDPGQTGKSMEGSPFKARHYDIPYRALVARDVDGLLMAGRCISGDFYAHASYRVTGNAVAMGEAAGGAAAASVRMGRLPHLLDWKTDIAAAAKQA